MAGPDELAPPDAVLTETGYSAASQAPGSGGRTIDAGERMMSRQLDRCAACSTMIFTVPGYGSMPQCSMNWLRAQSSPVKPTP